MAPEPRMRPVRMIPVGVLRTLCLPTNMSAPVPFASLIRVTPVQPGLADPAGSHLPRRPNALR